MKLSTLLVVTILSMLAPHAPAADTQPATVPATAPAITNATVQFNGTTYYLAPHDPALPDQFVPALTITAKSEIDKTFLLRANKGKIEQALNISSSYNGIALMDLDGDGKDEIILPAGQLEFAKLFPRAKYYWVSLSLQFTNSSGMHRIVSNFTSGEAFRTTSTGDLESISAPTYHFIGISSAGWHSGTFADLYGDGRPIPCRIVSWTKEVAPFGTIRTGKIELEGYAIPSKPGGPWIDETIHIPIPDGSEYQSSLKGILNPATFQPTALMIERDRIRTILPEGWTASISSDHELSVQSAKPVSYARTKDLAEHGREYVLSHHGSLNTNPVSLYVSIHPSGGGEPGGDILTADHRITVWNGTFGKDEVFFEPDVAKQYADVEAAIRRVVAAPLPATSTAPAPK